MTASMPALFIGHGAPPLLDDPVWSGQLHGLATALPTPSGIVMVSAHWESAPLAMSSPHPGTPLIYDFGGFDTKYYAEQYVTPDASTLARLVTSVLPDHMSVHEHATRGLDHGAWVPAKVMYPDASIPVVQLSIPSHDPAALVRLGQRLQPLREHGVLLVGSGFLTHGLPFLQDWRIEATPPSWSVEFDAWAAEALTRGDVETLSAFDRAPGMPYAHPTLEHLVPLFVALGAGSVPDAARSAAIDGFWMGLSKRSFVID